MPVSHLRTLPGSCAEAVTEATVPQRAQVFCVLPAARMRRCRSRFPEAPPPPARPNPRLCPAPASRRGNEGIPTSPETFETQENRAYRESRGLEDTPPPPRGFPLWLLPPPGSPATPQFSAKRGWSSSAPRLPPSPSSGASRQRPGRGGRQGTASSHAAAGAPSGEQRREPAGPSPHTPRRQPPPLGAPQPGQEHRQNEKIFFFLF